MLNPVMFSIYNNLHIAYIEFTFRASLKLDFGLALS